MVGDGSTDRPAEFGLRFGFRTRNVSDERLRFIRQLGVRDVFPTPVRSPDGIEFDEKLDSAKDTDRSDPEPERAVVVREGDVPSVEELTETKARIEDVGLRFTGLHTVFPNLYRDIAVGGPKRDQQVESFKRLVRNLGEAGVPILGYQWNPDGVGRTSTRRLRGGAEGTAFDLEEYQENADTAQWTDGAHGTGDVEDAVEYDESAFWDRYEWFLEEVLPVAEDAGVRMALHPSDPPVVEQLDGVPRLIRDVETLKRAMELVPSDAHGLKLCLGCLSEMGEDVVEAVRYFGERDEIVFVHFRDVSGSMPSFHETFVDEGSFDEYDVVRALQDVGFDGVLLADHVPRMEGDTQWGHRARAFTAGYVRALISAVEREP
jgi:mannonate dehydratase